LSFSYCLEPKDFSLTTLFGCNHSVNDAQIKICGITFGAQSALITNLSPQYHEEATDSSEKKVYKYWEIGVTIQADTEGNKFRRVLLDVGNRALWPHLTVGADGSVTAGTASTSGVNATPSQIYRWRTFDSTKGQQGTNTFFAYGNKYACADAQNIYRKLNDSLPEFQFEKLENMPLNNGYLYLDPVQKGDNFGKYKTRRFREYPVKAWSSLNMPAKGVDW
jgi:hypothetical protein